MAVVEDQRTQVYYWSSGISKNTFSFKHVTLIYLCLSTCNLLPSWRITSLSRSNHVVVSTFILLSLPLYTYFISFLFSLYLLLAAQHTKSYVRLVVLFPSEEQSKPIQQEWSWQNRGVLYLPSILNEVNIDSHICLIKTFFSKRRKRPFLKWKLLETLRFVQVFLFSSIAMWAQNISSVFLKAKILSEHFKKLENKAGFLGAQLF